MTDLGPSRAPRLFEHFAHPAQRGLRLLPLVIDDLAASCSTSISQRAASMFDSSALPHSRRISCVAQADVAVLDGGDRFAQADVKAPLERRREPDGREQRLAHLLVLGREVDKSALRNRHHRDAVGRRQAVDELDGAAHHEAALTDADVALVDQQQDRAAGIEGAVVRREERFVGRGRRRLRAGLAPIGRGVSSTSLTYSAETTGRASPSTST